MVGTIPQKTKKSCRSSLRLDLCGIRLASELRELILRLQLEVNEAGRLDDVIICV